MTTSRYAIHARAKTFLIALGLAAAFLAGDGVNSPSFAQKEKFERTKPHVNIGTIGQTNNNGSITQSPAQSGGDNLIVDGVRDFDYVVPPAAVLNRQRRSIRRKVFRPATRRRTIIRARRRR